MRSWPFPRFARRSALKSVGCFRADAAPRASRPCAASRASSKAIDDKAVGIFSHRLPRMVGFWKVWVERRISHEFVADVSMASLLSASGLPVRMWLCCYDADTDVVTDCSTEVDLALWLIEGVRGAQVTETKAKKRCWSKSIQQFLLLVIISYCSS